MISKNVSLHKLKNDILKEQNIKKVDEKIQKREVMRNLMKSKSHSDKDFLNYQVFLNFKKINEN